VLERKLQQRLVGILVLASFVLLIAPVLLDAEGRIPERITNIPPQPKRPDLSHIKVVESSEPQLSPLPDPDEVEFVITPQVTTKETTVAVNSGNSSDLWSVQVASFRDAKKANQFKEALRSAELQVYVREKILSDGSLFTQVFVGPLQSKSEADAMKAKVKDSFGEQGLVVRFREE